MNLIKSIYILKTLGTFIAYVFRNQSMFINIIIFY